MGERRELRRPLRVRRRGRPRHRHARQPHGGQGRRLAAGRRTSATTTGSSTSTRRRSTRVPPTPENLARELLARGAGGVRRAAACSWWRATSPESDAHRRPPPTPTARVERETGGSSSRRPAARCSPHLSDAENTALFGRAASPAGARARLPPAGRAGRRRSTATTGLIVAPRRCVAAALARAARAARPPQPQPRGAGARRRADDHRVPGPVRLRLPVARTCRWRGCACTRCRTSSPSTTGERGALGLERHVLGRPLPARPRASRTTENRARLRQVLEPQRPRPPLHRAGDGRRRASTSAPARCFALDRFSTRRSTGVLRRLGPPPPRPRDRGRSGPPRAPARTSPLALWPRLAAAPRRTARAAAPLRDARTTASPCGAEEAMSMERIADHRREPRHRPRDRRAPGGARTRARCCTAATPGRWPRSRRRSRRRAPRPASVVGGPARRRTASRALVAAGGRGPARGPGQQRRESPSSSRSRRSRLAEWQRAWPSTSPRRSCSSRDLLPSLAAGQQHRQRPLGRGAARVSRAGAPTAPPSSRSRGSPQCLREELRPRGPGHQRLPGGHRHHAVGRRPRRVAARPHAPARGGGRGRRLSPSGGRDRRSSRSSRSATCRGCCELPEAGGWQPRLIAHRGAPTALPGEHAGRVRAGPRATGRTSWRPTCGSPPTACWCATTTPPWTASPTARARSAS